jgi:hypothetical protein
MKKGKGKTEIEISHGLNTDETRILWTCFKCHRRGIFVEDFPQNNLAPSGATPSEYAALTELVRNWK